MTPLSEGGKVFCIVFALIGIPATLVMFGACVERLAVLSDRLFTQLFGRLQHLHSVFTIHFIHLGVLFAGLLLFVFLIPAAVFAIIEPGWNYFDAFYYCFISLTTVGLGDYIPGDAPGQQLRPLYKVLTTGELD